MENTKYANIAIVGLSAILAGCSSGSTPVATAVITPTPVSAVPAPVALPPEPEPAPTPTVTATATPTPTVTVTATPTPTVTVTGNPEDNGGGNPTKSDGQSTTPETNAKQGIFGTFAGTLIITEDYGWVDENGDPLPSDKGYSFPYSVTIPEKCGFPTDGDTCDFSINQNGEAYSALFTWNSGKHEWQSIETEQGECVDEYGDFVGFETSIIDERLTVISENSLNDVGAQSQSGVDGDDDGCEKAVWATSGTLTRR